MKKADLISLLKSYSINAKFISSQKYAKEYFDKDGTLTLSEEDKRLASMHVVESLIDLLKPSNEHTLLHLHYIKDIPVKQCAECIGISERTAFRWLDKAHKTIYEKITEGADDERN